MTQFDIMVSINADTREQAESMVASKLGAVYPLSAASSADGLSKVFENETEAFGHLIAGPRDWRGKQADEWLKRRGVDVEGVMLKALPRILERLPAEQVVQAMGEEVREAVGVMLMPWCMSEITKTRDQRDEALARAEKAEEQLRKLQESYDFVHEGRGRQRERAEQAEQERDAMHAAAEELRAQGAVLPEAHSGSPSGRTHDLKCWPEPFAAIANGRKAFEWRRDDRDFQLGDVLRLREWRPDSENYTGAEALCGVTYVLRGRFGVPDGFVVLGIGSPETTKPTCNGTGRKTEESDGQQVAVDMGRLGTADDARGSVPDCVQPEARVSDTHPKPPGIPASATIWAEVVDGLGRKVGAWFVPAIDGNPPHVSFDDGSEDLVWWMPHIDHAFNDMPGKSFCTKVVAAQCRQLYERGMAAEKARLIEVSSGNLPPIEVPDVFGMLSDRLGYTKPARPACIPSHIADTDWTVIEGRAVWRPGLKLKNLCYIADSREHRSPWCMDASSNYDALSSLWRADVPQSLFLAARRWMGWEKEETEAAKQPGQTPERYRPKTDVQKLGKLVEECGEALAAAGKTMRWGLDSTNPELPPEQQETNAAWLARELCDLEEAIGFAREVLAAHEGGAQ